MLAFSPRDFLEDVVAGRVPAKGERRPFMCFPLLGGWKSAMSHLRRLVPVVGKRPRKGGVEIVLEGAGRKVLC